MTHTDRHTGRRYQLLKVFVTADAPAGYAEAATGRRYNIVKRYL